MLEETSFQADVIFLLPAFLHVTLTSSLSGSVGTKRKQACCSLAHSRSSTEQKHAIPAL